MWVSPLILYKGMIDYKSINKNESGLSVRAKINSMFSALIDGNEGMNSVWKKFLEVAKNYSDLTVKVEDGYDDVKEQVLKGFDYTDKTAADLLVYINGMNGGISGFAVDTSFKPNFPEDKPATVLGAGAGTYTYMLDINGSPITIEDEDALIIFYKGADSTYWQYKTVFARVDESKELVTDVTKIKSSDIYAFKKNGVYFYPVTELGAVVVRPYMVSAKYFINEINVSVAFPTEGIDGTNKYDISKALTKIFRDLVDTPKYFGLGSRCTFVNSDGDYETWVCAKSGFVFDSRNWVKIDRSQPYGRLLTFNVQGTGTLSLDLSNTIGLFDSPINPDDYTSVTIELYSLVSYQGSNRAKGVFLLKYKKGDAYYYAINWKESKKYAIADSRYYNNTAIAISSDDKTQDYIRSTENFTDTTYRGICGGNLYLNVSTGAIIRRNTSTTDWFERVIDIEAIKNDLDTYKKREVFLTEDEYDTLEDKDENKLYYIFEE